MKDVCDAFKMANCELMKNSWKKMGQSLFIIESEYSFAIEMLQIKYGQSRKIVPDIFTQTTDEYNF